MKPPTRVCPICGKPAIERYRPFCSGRCTDIDLAQWLRGGYVVPGEDEVVDSEGEDQDFPH